MPARFTALLVAFLLTTSARLVDAADPGGLEIVVQQGHGHDVGSVKLLRDDSREYLVTSDDTDVRAWERPLAGGRWLLKRVWKQYRDFSADETPWPYVIVGDQSRAELYWLGEWSAPVATTNHGLPPDLHVSSVLPLWQRPGIEPSLTLLLSRDSGCQMLRCVDRSHCDAWTIDGEPLESRHATRIGPGELALESNGQWHLYRQLASGAWTPWQPIGAPPVISYADFFDRPNGLLLKDGQGTTHYWYRSAAGDWIPLARVLPRLPSRIHQVEATGERHVLVVQEEGDSDGDGVPFRKRWYLHQNDDTWIELAKVLGADGAIDNVRLFAGKDGIAAQVAGKGWRYLMRSGHSWVPIQQVLTDAPAHLFDVLDFGAGRGIGVRGFVEGKRERWIFYILDDGRWRELHQVIPEAPARIERVQSDDLDVGLRLLEDGAFTRPGGGWRLYGAERGRFEDLSRTLSLPKSFSQGSYAGFSHDLIRLYVDGANHWFAHSADGWQSLDALLASRAGSAQSPLDLPAAVRSAERVAPGVARLDRMDSDTPLFLVARPDGSWGHLNELLPGKPTVVSVSVLSGGRQLLIRTEQGREPQRLLATAGGWKLLSDLLPQLQLKPVAADVFLDGRGIAVEEAGDPERTGRYNAWRYYLRGNDGVARELLPQLPGGPPRAAAVYGIAGQDGIVVEEEGDANRNGRPDEWFAYFNAGGRWTELRTLVPSTPPRVWHVTGFAAGRGIAVQDQGDSNRDGRSFEWHYYLADARGLYQPIESVLGAGSAVVTAVSFWNGGGLATREQSGRVRWFERRQDSWTQIAEPHLGDDLTEVRSDASMHALAIRVIDAAHPGNATWKVAFFDPTTGGWAPAARQLPGSPTGVTDVTFFEGKPWVALRGEGKTPPWTWYERRGSRFERRGTSPSADWIGSGTRLVGNDRIEIRGAVHTVDGAPSRGVPEPTFWLHNSPALPELGNVLRVAGGIVPADVELYGVGPGGTVLVYRQGGRLRATGFTRGSVGWTSQPLVGSKKTITLIANQLPDGTARLHRSDDPTSWIWRYARTGMGRLFFDGRGYFYNETEKVAERMSFRNGSDVYTFDQLASRLFRPDKLEQTLRLPAGALFALSGNDQKRIRTARAYGNLDLAALRPPSLAVKTASARVKSPEVVFSVTARGRALAGARITVGLEGLGGSRGDDALKCAGGQECTLTRGIGLVPGKNVVRVTITDANGLTTTERRVVWYDPPQNVRHDLWVAILAPSFTYKNLPPLQMTQNDADAVASAVKTQDGKQYGHVHVKRWCDVNCDHAPTRGEILRGVPSFFADMKDGDAALLYVSGHGVAMGSSGESAYYFVPSDGESEHTKTLIDWAELRSLVMTPRLSHKMLVLDTCHAGAVIMGDERVRQRLVQEMMDLDGVYVLSATAAGADAFERGDLGNGIFTFAFKTALAGKADRSPEDGRIMFDELAHYVGEEVRVLAHARQLRQEPSVPIVDESLDYVIAAVPRIRWRARVDLFTDAGDLDLEGSARWAQQLERAIEGLRTSNDPLAVDLHVQLRKRSDGTYRIVVRDRAKRDLFAPIEAAEPQLAAELRRRLDAVR